MTAAIATFIPVIALSVVAFWQHYPVLFVICAAISLFAGLSAPDIYADNGISYTIGLAFIAYAFICLGMSYKYIFTSREV